MAEAGVTVQKGGIAQTPEEALNVAKALDPSGGLILKSQVHAGGRGKGKLTSGLQGGVKICKTPEEVADFTKQMIGYNLITNQTKAEGLPVKAVLIHEGVDIERQIYLAILLDRKYQGPAIVASKNGGMEIEEVAHNHPESIFVQPIDIKKGITNELGLKVVKELDLMEYKDQAIDQIKKLYNMFIKTDATQIEINPWALTPQKKLYCVDAKIEIDDSATFRQQRLFKLKKESVASEDVDPNEDKATEIGINYVGLDGNIGCMVNGAGLAMSTMDIIKLKGGLPANFLDVGGGANTEQVKSAFQILLAHKQVKAILVNIFGGIMRGDIIANGIIKATQEVGLTIPLVVRLTGTNADIGGKLLSEFAEKNKGKYNIIVASDLNDAAEKAVKCVA